MSEQIVFLYEISAITEEVSADMKKKHPSIIKYYESIQSTHLMSNNLMVKYLKLLNIFPLSKEKRKKILIECGSASNHSRK